MLISLLYIFRLKDEHGKYKTYFEIKFQRFGTSSVIEKCTDNITPRTPSVIPNQEINSKIIENYITIKKEQESTRHCQEIPVDLRKRVKILCLFYINWLV